MTPIPFAANRCLARLIAAALVAAAPAAMAQTGAPSETPGAACATMDAALPEPLASWTAKVDISAAASPAALPSAQIRLGRAARVTLHAAQQVAYVAPPAKPGGQDTYGGLLAFTVSTPGTYRIGLSAGAWIDVLRDGIAQTSTAHGHGPACSTLHKIVDFSLQPGGYALQLSGAADPDIGVVIIKAP